MNIDPDNPLLPVFTLEEAVRILESYFNDVKSIPEWAIPAAASVARTEYVLGSGRMIRAHDLITRAEAAVIVSRALKTMPGYKPGDFTRFKDAGDLPAWAEAAIAEGLLEGYPDETLKPNQPITRGEALEVFYKLFVDGMGW